LILSDPIISVLSEKSGNGTDRGTDGLGIWTETGSVFFRLYFQNSVFDRNFSDFIPDFTRILT
jgi:hypothetical protein